LRAPAILLFAAPADDLRRSVALKKNCNQAA
jgi:hypothetical protein